jgi:hypothetical protein
LFTSISVSNVTTCSQALLEKPRVVHSLKKFLAVSNAVNLKSNFPGALPAGKIPVQDMAFSVLKY